jgi:hypothetical protein
MVEQFPQVSAGFEYSLIEAVRQRPAEGFLARNLR